MCLCNQCTYISFQLLNTFSNFGGTWPKFFVLEAVDSFTIASCSVPDANGQGKYWGLVTSMNHILMHCYVRILMCGRDWIDTMQGIRWHVRHCTRWILHCWYSLRVVGSGIIASVYSTCSTTS